MSIDSNRGLHLKMETCNIKQKGAKNEFQKTYHGRGNPRAR